MAFRDSIGKNGRQGSPGSLSQGRISDLHKHLADLPADREIVVYCRGPYCVLAAEAVKLLRQKGRRALRLAEGYPEWRDAGMPIESSATAGFPIEDATAAGFSIEDAAPAASVF